MSTDDEDARSMMDAGAKISRELAERVAEHGSELRAALARFISRRDRPMGATDLPEHLEAALDESLRLDILGRCQCGGVLDVHGLFYPDMEIFCPYGCAT